MTMRFHRPRPLETRPTVSVVVPCYNYGRYLPLAVGSALDQEGLDLEVLVVDDASTDDSLEVALALAARDPRVSVLPHEQNAGHIATYNEGLAKVSGDYVVLLSADDALPRNALTRAVALMEHHPRVGLVFGFPRNFTDRPEPESSRVRSWSTWSGREWFARTCRTGRNVVMSPEVVMRRLAWDEIGAYDADLPHAADMAVWLRTALRWDVGRVNGPAQAHYRVHDANMHLSQFAGMATDLRQRRMVFDRVLTGAAPSRWTGTTRLRAAADRALARTAVRLARGEGIGADPGADVETFERFACETWPGVVATPLWRSYQRERRTGRARPGAPFARRVRTHLQWRRWRRYGL